MTLFENKFTVTLYSVVKGNVKLIETKFYRNKIGYLVRISSNSSAIIQNNTVTENHFLGVVYGILKNSVIQLNNVTFTRNKLKTRLLILFSNSTAIIQNNTLMENYVVWTVYSLWNSTIQLNDVRFIRNKLMENLLRMTSNSSAIIQSNTLTENNIFWQVYYLSKTSTIQLNDVAFTSNMLTENLLYMVLNCRAKLINNKLVGNNNLGEMFLAHSSYLKIDRILIENNTLSQLILVESCNVSLDSMKIRKNKITEGIIHVEDTAGKITNTYIENNDNFIASGVYITSPYLSNRHFPFEITNVEIIWVFEVPFPTQPIFI